MDIYALNDMKSKGIAVLGMHRSGTSTVAGILELCGVWLGNEDELLAPQNDNPKGFFERHDLHRICQKLLKAGDSSWWHLSGFDHNAIPQATRRDLGEQFRELVEVLSDHGTWAVKEPTLSFLFPILEQYVPDAVCVLPVRNPVEIAKSLRTRNGFSIPHGIALWEIYTRNALAASQTRARVLVSYSDLIADPQGATERLVWKLREAGIEGLTLPEDVNGFVSPALHREAARETDLEALLNPAQMDLWAALKGRGGNLVAEGERGVSEGALVLLRDLERQYAARLKTDERLKHQDFQVHELQKEIEEIQVDAARHRAQNESLARQLAETETDLAKAQAEVEIHKTRNEDFSRKLAGQRVELTAAREEVAAYDKRNNNLLKKIKARDSELARFQREAGERSVEIADLRADLELTQQLLNAGLAQLQRKLDNARQQPSKFMRRKILSRVLYFFSRQHLLFSERRRKHFLHSAQKRDPKRDDLERIRSKARRQIAAQAKKRSAARNDKTDKMEARDKDIGFTPSTSSAEAIAASAISPHTASMSRKEAERVFSEVTAHLEPGQRPRRFFPDFDTGAAQRYVAAANAFYDDDCAALKATVIMPTYNRGNQIASAIRSVLDQTHGNLELLVIDDGSTDDTPAQLVRFSDDPRLRVFHENHAGVSVARNTGLAHASGDYVFYLDSDNTWTPDHVKLMLVGLRATGAECAYAASCVVSEAGELLGYRGAPFDWDACLAANYVDMNVMAHSRDLFHQCGGFDTNLRRMVDWDLILRYTKSRTVPFFPFIGCMYLNHGSDKNRITVSQPYLYRRIVSEKNRLGLKSGAEALDSLQLSFAIKIAAPYKKRAQWGDFHYAESLSNALQRLGHSVRIDFGGDWNTPKARKDDVVLVLRGLAGYTPHRSQLTLMWNISHPDQVSYEEYAGCHQVLIASRSYAALLSMILERPVYPLLQCTDTERFHLAPDAPPVDPGARGIFVGNSRNEFRPMVRWSVENDVGIDIYGTRWSQFIPEALIAGENVPNTELGEKYRSARFVLNDHWQSMKDFGFVSNRVFDVIACGGRLVSDPLPSLEAIFGDAVETVHDERGLVEAVSKPPLSPERRREAADYVQSHHSFDTRAKAICNAVRSAMMPTAGEVTAEPNFASSVPRRRVGLILQRGRAWWTSSAYIRLIAPLTTDYAHEVAGLDLVALDGPDDPRLESCDICIVQRVGIPDPDAARRLMAKLAQRDVPLYVDTDDAFFLHERYRTADTSLRLLMGAAREVWFSTSNLADLYDDVARGKSRVRRNDLDPRLWRDYRNPVSTTFEERPVRFVYMGTATHHEDLAVVLPAFERLARDYPGRFDLTLVGITSAPPQADWLRLRNPPRDSGGYPAFARFATRELDFDVGIAPLVASPFNAAKSDIKFLDYSAMGLLSVVAEGPAYRDCIEAGLAVGCEATEEAWYDALARIVETPSSFADMRMRAADHVWQERNVLTAPSPLADLLV